MENLMDALKREIERNKELMVEYVKIGPVGDFARKAIGFDVARAENAIASGDAVEMLRIYNVLKGNR